jgi:hypothetical protein
VSGRKGAAPRRRRMTRLLGLCTAAATRGEDTPVLLVAFPSFCALSYGGYGAMLVYFCHRVCVISGKDYVV